MNKIGPESGNKRQVIKPVWWEAVPTLLMVRQLPLSRFSLAALANQTDVCCANKQQTNSLPGH